MPQLVTVPRLSSIPSQPQAHQNHLPPQHNHQEFPSTQQFNPHHQQQMQIEQQQQHPEQHPPPPLNHIPTMPSFPTFQIPQHPSTAGGDAGHDMFLQSMSRDMADGGPSTPMEINATSSQGFSNMISSEEITSSHHQISPTQSPPGSSPHHHSSPHHPAEQQQNHYSSQNSCQYDRSVSGWLQRLGVGQYADAFQHKGIGNTDQLDEIQLEDFNDMNIPTEARQVIWKAILELRNPQMAGTPSLSKNCSSASTLSVRSQCSFSSQQATPNVYHATRFTLKQTLSFKVKEEEKEEENGANGQNGFGDEINK